jgi:hypothetical protein
LKETLASSDARLIAASAQEVLAKMRAERVSQRT